jgi:hypothetical protein
MVAGIVKAGHQFCSTPVRQKAQVEPLPLEEENLDHQGNGASSDPQAGEADSPSELVEPDIKAANVVLRLWRAQEIVVRGIH